MSPKSLALVTFACACSLLLALTLSWPVAARDLTFVAYGGGTQDADREAYWEPFSKATGIKFIEDQPSDLAKIRAMVETGNVTWDVVEIVSSDAQLLCDEGKIEKLDWSQIGDKEQYFDWVVKPCSYGFIAAAWALAYNADNIKSDNAPKTWADFWNVEKWPGKRGFWYTPQGALEFALMADGVAAHDVYTVLRTPGGVDRAFNKLDELKPNILWWKTGAESVARLASGEYTMAMVWNGRTDISNRVDKTNFVNLLSAGFLIQYDAWVVPKGSPKLAEAYQFLKFVNDPKAQAKFIELEAYGTASPAALEFVDAERRAEVPTSPENVGYGVSWDDDFWADNYDSLTERFNAWASQ